MKGSKDTNLKKFDPGLTIMMTPINPITIAVDLFIPNFSPKIGTAKTAAKIGAECTIATFSERYKRLHNQLLKKPL